MKAGAHTLPLLSFFKLIYLQKHTVYLICYSLENILAIFDKARIHMTNSTRFYLINIIGCFAFLSIPVFSSPDFGLGWQMIYINPFQKSFVRFVLLLILFYTSYYYFVPKLYFNQKKWLFGLALIVSYLALIGITNAIFGTHQFMPKPNNNHNFPQPREHSELFDAQFLIPFLLVIALAFLIKITNRLTEINDEKRNAEVSYLKAQINPHFLFNMLNNIYSTALINSPETANQILHLSNFIEYNLYHSKKELVPLNEEFEYLNNFIELQKIRLGDKLNVEIELPKGADKLLIQPLLLLPVIENSIKHGVENSIRNSWIKIKIEIKFF